MQSPILAAVHNVPNRRFFAGFAAHIQRVNQFVLRIISATTHHYRAVYPTRKPWFWGVMLA